MKLPISPRMLACAGFVRPGQRVADIGCDHGYLGIYLLQKGIARSIIASDIREGPLLSAVQNAEKYGVRSQMEFYLSDGVQTIPRDFDALVCAGMGGDTMVSILKAAPWLQNARYRLILQCQSKTPLLRQYLSRNGWHIENETVLRDGKFLYTVMEALFDPSAPRLTVGGTWISPALLRDPTQEVIQYCRYVLEGLRIATAHREDKEKQAALAELSALQQDPHFSFLKEVSP